jgi:hypothetical protein
MSVDVEQGSMQLSQLLARVAALQEDKDRISAELSKVNKELKAVESLAVEQLGLSGLDGVRAAGKSWFVREFFSVSIPSENKERVLEIASEACPELVSVNTASLKSWLMEERRSQDSTDGGLAEGTPFAGLISEFREMRLSHRTLG